jgi:two-component system, cell cycle response regulator
MAATTYQVTNRESVVLLLHVLNERRPGVLEDFNKVARLATATAQSFELSEYEVECIELAGRLYDVGTLVVPDAILNKASSLDAKEWVIMRTHAEVGERIVRSAPSLAHIADLVRSHHERVDGGGYPDRLGGEEIPFGASIVSVCASFVAMMRQRPFSDAITVEEALAEIRRGAGSQFDRRVVEMFCDLLRRALA